MLVLSENFNIAVNDADVKKSARYSRCNRTRCKRDPVYCPTFFAIYLIWELLYCALNLVLLVTFSCRSCVICICGWSYIIVHFQQFLRFMCKINRNSCLFLKHLLLQIEQVLQVMILKDRLNNVFIISIHICRMWGVILSFSLKDWWDSLRISYTQVKPLSCPDMQPFLWADRYHCVTLQITPGLG